MEAGSKNISLRRQGRSPCVPKGTVLIFKKFYLFVSNCYSSYALNMLSESILYFIWPASTKQNSFTQEYAAISYSLSIILQFVRMGILLDRFQFAIITVTPAICKTIIFHSYTLNIFPLFCVSVGAVIQFNISQIKKKKLSRIIAHFCLCLSTGKIIF